MNDKYYTPTIEEFHIGFEYEVLINREWKQVSIDDSERLSYFMFHTTNESLQKDPIVIRVKYLDKEDIESLGWIPDSSGFDKYWSKIIDIKDGSDWQINYQFENNFLTIYDWSSEIRFRGFIKNKSELKVLLKQLGI